LEFLKEVSEREETENSAVFELCQSGDEQMLHMVTTADRNMEENGAAGTCVSTSKETIWDKLARESSRQSALRDRINLRSGTPVDSVQEKSDQNSTVLCTVMQSSFSSEKELIFHDTHETDLEDQALESHRKVVTIDTANMFAIREGSDSDVTPAAGDAVPYDDLGLTHPHDLLEASESLVVDYGRIAFDFEENAGLRKRQSQAMKRLSKSTNEKWSKVVQIVKETSRRHAKEDDKGLISNGSWSMPTSVTTSWR
jgi:hypothetical protein